MVALIHKFWKTYLIGRSVSWRLLTLPCSLSAARCHKWSTTAKLKTSLSLLQATFWSFLRLKNSLLCIATMHVHRHSSGSASKQYFVHYENFMMKLDVTHEILKCFLWNIANVRWWQCYWLIVAKIHSFINSVTGTDLISSMPKQ